MHLSGTTAVTTALLVAFALFVMYTRLKNWFDSNIPLIFYVILITYMRSIEGAVPVWLICTGFGLTLLLRFEFMSTGFARVVKFMEIGALGTMVYFATSMILRY
jgi:hypothetical protein